MEAYIPSMLFFNTDKKITVKNHYWYEKGTTQHYFFHFFSHSSYFFNWVLFASHLTNLNLFSTSILFFPFKFFFFCFSFNKLQLFSFIRVLFFLFLMDHFTFYIIIFTWWIKVELRTWILKVLQNLTYFYTMFHS